MSQCGFPLRELLTDRQKKMQPFFAFIHENK